MCQRCDDAALVAKTPNADRRRLMFGGMGAAAAGLAMAGAGQAAAQPTVQAASEAVGPGPYRARAFAALSAQGNFGQIEIERRAPRANDVVIDVLYAGICHSDIHTVHSDWRQAQYPVVPGHEVVGRVVAVGPAVTLFKVGDIAGVGCMVDSCGTCANCLADREQNCLNGTTFTYGAPDKVSGGLTHGGYSSRMVVTEKFAIRIPPGMNLAGVPPLLCAGITTFSPMQHWKLERGQKIGVIGLGGLGHMAVKLAVARGAETTIFTTSPGKIADAARLGAKEAVLWSDQAAMARLANTFDLMIATVPVSFAMQPFMDLLKLDATLVNVGALGVLDGGLSGMSNGYGRKSLAGSMIGGIAETQQVIDYCGVRGITADVEVIRPDQIEQAYDRVVGKDVRYRFVIDMTTQG